MDKRPPTKENPHQRHKTKGGHRKFDYWTHYCDPEYGDAYSFTAIPLARLNWQATGNLKIRTGGRANCGVFTNALIPGNARALRGMLGATHSPAVTGFQNSEG